jgi:hypothetical protein
VFARWFRQRVKEKAGSAQVFQASAECGLSDLFTKLLQI